MDNFGLVSRVVQLSDSVGIVVSVCSYLVCMGTDCDSNIRIKADQTLKKLTGNIQASSR